MRVFVVALALIVSAPSVAETVKNVCDTVAVNNAAVLAQMRGNGEITAAERASGNEFRAICTRGYNAAKNGDTESARAAIQAAELNRSLPDEGGRLIGALEYSAFITGYTLAGNK